MIQDELIPTGSAGTLQDEDDFEDNVAAGWTAQLVRYDRFNRQFFRGDTAINGLIANTPPAVSERETAIALNLYTDSDCFGPATAPENLIEAGTTASEFTTVYPTTISGVPKLLVVDTASADATIVVVDVATMTVDATPDLSGALPASTWWTIGLCADGTNAYVLFADNTNSGRVQAYDMTAWTVASGWPATGVANDIQNAVQNKASVINATSDKIAVCYNYANLPTYELLYLFDKSDGTLLDSGHGDCTGTGSLPCHSICSNGTNLFFYAGGELCSASLADLTTGCGGANWPLTVANGGQTAVAADMVVSVGNTNGGITVAAASDATSFTFTSTTFKAQQVAYDGISFWVLGEWDPAASTNWRPCIAKLNLDWVGHDPVSGEVTKTNLQDYVTIFNVFDGSIGAGGFDETAHLQHDGRDFWIASYTATAAQNKYIVRFPLTHWR